MRWYRVSISTYRMEADIYYSFNKREYNVPKSPNERVKLEIEFESE